MYRYILLNFILIFFSFNQLSSQNIEVEEPGLSATGYMGKKLSLNYDLHLAPVLRCCNANGERGFLSFNANNKISLDYVVTGHSQLGMSFNFYNTKDTGSFKDLYYGKNNTDNGRIGEIAYIFDISMTQLGLYYKMHVNEEGISAPLGSFWTLGVNRTFINVNNIKDKNFEEANEKDIDPDEVKENLDINGGSSWLLYLEYGGQRILWDKLIIRGSLRFGYHLGSDDNNNSVDGKLYKRIRNFEAVGIGFGVGYLIM